MSSGIVYARHGGHSGDIVYSLAFLKRISFLNGARVNLGIERGVKSKFANGMEHPNGEFLMTQGSFEFLEPLLKYQNYLDSVEFVDGSSLDSRYIKLDAYRDVRGIDLSKGNIASYLRKLLPIDLDLGAAYLSAPTLRLPANSVICGFSRRYRNISLMYGFLSEVKNLFFVGLKDEFEHFRQRNGLDNLKYIAVKNGLELASVVSQATFFLGNQSLSFSIAEGLKVPRILELCEICPNVVPVGLNAYEILYERSARQILRRAGLVSAPDCPEKIPLYKLYI